MAGKIKTRYCISMQDHKPCEYLRFLLENREYDCKLYYETLKNDDEKDNVLCCSRCMHPKYVTESESINFTNNKITIEIETGNDSFVEDFEGTINYVMKNISKKIVQGHKDGTSNDINGNKVATFTIK